MSENRIRYTDLERAVANTLRTIQDVGTVTTYTIIAGVLTELGGHMVAHELSGQAATSLVSGVIAAVNAGIEISIATGALTGSLISASGTVGAALSSGAGSILGSVATTLASTASRFVTVCSENRGMTGAVIGALGAYIAQNRASIMNQANSLQIAITSGNRDRIMNIIMILLSNLGIIVENDDMAQRLLLTAPSDGVINRVQDDAATIATRLSEYANSESTIPSSQSTIGSEGLVDDVDMPNEEIDGAHENDDTILGLRKRGDDNESQSTTSSDRRFKKAPRSARAASAEEEDRLSTGSSNSIASEILNYRANVHDLSNIYAILNVVAGITEDIRSNYVRDDGTVDHASDLVAFQEQLETASSTCSSAASSSNEKAGGKKKRKTVRRKQAKKAAKKTAKKRVKKSAKKPAKKAARKQTKKA